MLSIWLKRLFSTIICLAKNCLYLSTLKKAEGPDLQVSSDQTWDLEVLEFKVAEDYDLAALHEKLDKEQFSSYLDPKGSLLALTDMSNIEVWLTK